MQARPRPFLRQPEAATLRSFEFVSWGRPMRTKALLAATALLAASLAGHAQASTFTVEGDLGALTVVAQDTPRNQIVSEIATRFELQTVGFPVDTRPVSGRFSGNLGQVLRSILAGNGYAIAYEAGRPVRVTFPDNRDTAALQPYAAASVDPMSLPPQPGMEEVAPPPAPVSAEPVEPTPIEKVLRRAAAEQLSIKDRTEPPPPPQADGQDMQKQIAEATEQAVIQLKALTDELNSGK